MKKYTFLISIVLLLSSCVTLQLKGNYPSPNQFTESSKSFEDVWTKTIDFFAISGIPITTIDKSSGIIIASKMSFVNNYTREGKDKLPIDKTAFVVIPTVRGGFGNVLEPKSPITGEWRMDGDWNVRIKTVGYKTVVNVNLLNIQCFYKAGFSSTMIPIKSTGVFEKQIIEMIK